MLGVLRDAVAFEGLGGLLRAASDEGLRHTIATSFLVV